MKVTGPWIKERLTGQRGEHAELARHMGIDPPRLSRALKGDRSLLRGEPEAALDFLRARGLLRSEDLAQLDSNLVMAAEAADSIAVYDISAAAGRGLVPIGYEAPIDHVRFPRGFLAGLTSTPAKSLAIIGVKGDSMIPTLHHDDAVIVDTTKTNMGYDGLFVLRLDDALVVKRIARGRGPGRVLLISDNRELYPATDYAIADIAVVGRVLLAFKRF